jgi:Leucine rich repeat/Protein tyrosine and serine/threonine kinase
VVRLDLRNQGLTAVPAEVFAHAQTLEVLDLSGNRLDSLPEGMARLSHLKILFASDNAFTELPAVLGRCQSLEMVGFKANRIARVAETALPARLRWLILTDNALESLPETIGHCQRLQKLMLAGNRLRGLPTSLARCGQLELLRLAANAFERAEHALPPGLLKLPRLSWLAYAGNPFCEAWGFAGDSSAPADPPMPGVAIIDWQQLHWGECLGEGASGTIHAAQWAAEPQAAPRAVAVKIFKGEVTSDGWPRSEMSACIAAGPHPHLIAVLGRLIGHPQGREGLVLGRIPAGYRNLAGPPSFDSCTRDVYPPGFALPLAQADLLLHGVRSAVQQLHRRGVLHGDLYAHNILFNAEGHALLGDFGAASPLPSAESPLREALMALDQRALGVLQAELMLQQPR